MYVQKVFWFVCLFVLCRRGRHDAQMFSTLMIQKRKNGNIFFQNPKSTNVRNILQHDFAFSMCLYFVFKEQKKCMCFKYSDGGGNFIYIFSVACENEKIYTHTIGIALNKN